jgi:multidrug efflux pump
MHKIEQAFKTDFPEVRGRVKLLPNGPPVPYPVQFQVSGPDIGVVRGVADQVKDVLRANPNAVGVNDNWNESVKVLRLDLDQDKLRALGVTSQAVRRTVATVLSGTTIGQFRESNRLIDIVVRQPLEERSTMSVLANANVPTSSGRPVPLSQLARIEFVWEPGVVWRWAASGRSWCRRTWSRASRGRPCRARSAPSWTGCARSCRPATASSWKARRPTAPRPKPRSPPTCRWCCSSCSRC